MMPNCSFSALTMDEASLGPAGDTPEAQLHVVAGDDPAAKAGAIGVTELVVVEESTRIG